MLYLYPRRRYLLMSLGDLTRYLPRFRLGVDGKSPTVDNDPFGRLIYRQWIPSETPLETIWPVVQYSCVRRTKY